MRAPAALVALLAGALLLAACGGGGASAPATGTNEPVAAAPSPAGSLAAILGLATTTRSLQTSDVLVVTGQDYAAGRDQRIAFAVLGKDGTALAPAPAGLDVYLAPDALSPPLGPFHATYSEIGVPMGQFPLNGVYVVHATVPTPGSYFIAARLDGQAKPASASGGIEIKRAADAPSVGSKAPASANPTIASTGGDFKKLTTASPPDSSLLEYSVADSLGSHTPFVVVFATPAFCSSRLCGPTVVVAQEAQKRLKARGVRFIHIEIYTDNDPSKPFNPWVTEWGLHTEPWTFVVDSTGIIREEFEGAVSVAELVSAVGTVANG